MSVLNRRSFRYPIAFLLFACLCVAGFFAGYRTGYSSGYSSGRAKYQSEEPYPVVYQVGDLIRATHDAGGSLDTPLDLSMLMQATQSVVFPGEWEQLGGNCSMAPFPSLELLVIDATSGVHARTAELFEDMDSLKPAITEIEQQRLEWKRMQQEQVSKALEPVSKRLGETLVPLAGDVDMSGKWNVKIVTPDGKPATNQYTFIDQETFETQSSDPFFQPGKQWFSISDGAMVSLGVGFHAAMGSDDDLILVPTNDPTTYLRLSRTNH
ncbi:hypothetical protein [Rhodopirellula europaea]|nr:hypothetical protein [Rhodopirellula europaea]